MKRTYRDYLNVEFLNGAISKTGFRDTGPLEDFIMDFELHNIVRGRLDACL